MKILIFNITAQYGSTGKIAQILREGYKAAGHQVEVCYGRDKNVEKPQNAFKFTYEIEKLFTYFLMRLYGIPGKGLFLSMRRLFQYMDREKPDLVHLLNIHGYYVDEYSLLIYLKKRKIPVIYTMCDEYPYTAKCSFTGDCNKFKEECHHCYKKHNYPPSWIFDKSKKLFKLKKDIYNDYSNLIFAGCGYVYERAKESKLLGDKRLVCIGEPIDLDGLFYPRDSASLLKKELYIPENDIVVMTAAVLSNPRKGGKFFLDMYNQMKGIKGFTFVYVGYDTTEYENLTDGSIIKIPYVESLDKFAELMSLADVFISTTYADTVPNAVINALGCGTPVCAFNIGGMRSIRKKDEEVLKIVPFGNVQGLKDAVLSIKRKSDDVIIRCRNLVYDDFSSKSVMDKYVNIVNEITLQI